MTIGYVPHSYSGKRKKICILCNHIFEIDKMPVLLAMVLSTTRELKVAICIVRKRHNVIAINYMLTD